MAIKCLIVCTNELIGKGVEELCKTQADMDVVNTQLRNGKGLIQLIEQHQPDVLIADEVEEKADIERLTGFLQPLLRFSDMRVILVNDLTNSLHVFQRQDFSLRQVSDLLSIVRDQVEDE
jgi:chemotaxis response regulator CheB